MAKVQSPKFNFSDDPMKRYEQLADAAAQVDELIKITAAECRKAGHSWNDIAEAAGLPVSTVRRTWANATGYVQEKRAPKSETPKGKGAAKAEKPKAAGKRAVKATPAKTTSKAKSTPKKKAATPNVSSRAGRKALATTSAARRRSTSITMSVAKKGRK